MDQVDWKRNLFITWLGCFVVGASFSLVMPFISLYIRSLGVTGGKVAFFSGLAFSLPALASGVVAPVWGRLADKYGRKPMMIRASLVMTVTMGGLAFVPNVWWLILLRLLMGFFSGYIPNSTAMIATQAPKDKTGYALGTLATAMVTGTLIGPSLGGLLAEWVGMRRVFLLVGTMLFLASILTIFFVRENFTTIPNEKMLSNKEIMSKVKNKQILLGLLITTGIIQVTSQSIEPFVTLYVKSLEKTNVHNLMFVSGLIVSAVGLSAMLSSSFLGRIGDKYGPHRLILAGLFFTFIIYFPMAFVQNPLQLGILRFLLGFGTGALMPAVNSLLAKITPKEGVSRIFAYAQMSSNLGMVSGPLVGSSIAACFNYRAAIVGTSLFVVLNFIWSLINFRKYLREREI